MSVGSVGLGFQTRFVQPINAQPMSSPRLFDTSLIRYNVWVFLIFLKSFFLEKYFSWVFDHKIIKLEDYFTFSFFSNRGWAPRLWVEFGRRKNSSTQLNSLNKVECPTPSMSWIGAPTSGFVQPNDHPTFNSIRFRVFTTHIAFYIRIEARIARWQLLISRWYFRWW
jgi:hypothetical protein